jgi:hypothetical protein
MVRRSSRTCWKQPMFKMMWNLLEDGMIERAIRERFNADMGI